MTGNPIDDISWREGDIYFWSFKKPPEHMPYHCCACKAIVRGEYLCDIFWSTPNDGRSWTKEQALGKLNLKYMGNFDELEIIADWVAEYYERKDIVNLGHPNSSRDACYRRKGARRSKEVMLEQVRSLREQTESDMRSATGRLERLKETEKWILNDEDLEKIYL